MKQQVVIFLLSSDRSQVSTKTPAPFLGRSPEQLLLAPEVALTILLLPARGAVDCAGVFLAADTFCSKIVVGSFGLKIKMFILISTCTDCFAAHKFLFVIAPFVIPRVTIMKTYQF